MHPVNTGTMLIIRINKEKIDPTGFVPTEFKWMDLLQQSLGEYKGYNKASK